MEAATGNERGPAVDRRYCGMCSCSVNDDRRRRRPGYRNELIQMVTPYRSTCSQRQGRRNQIARFQTSFKLSTTGVGVLEVLGGGSLHIVGVDTREMRGPKHTVVVHGTIRSRRSVDRTPGPQSRSNHLVCPTHSAMPGPQWEARLLRRR